MAQLKKPPQLSRLESLPVEILQTIFLYSLEINLPRASFSISGALSNPLLYTWLTRLAFSSLNQSSRHGFFTPEFLPPPLNIGDVTWDQRQHLQTVLLTCRWCTLEFMRKCQREYVEHAIKQKCADLVFSPQDKAILENLEPHFAELKYCDHAEKGRRGKGDLVIPATRQKPENHDENDKTQKQPSSNSTSDKPEHQDQPPSRSSSRSSDHKVAIWFHFGAVQIREQNEVYFEKDLFRFPCSIPVCPGRIPDKLLREPWSESQFEFLDLLSGDFYLDEDDYMAERSDEITSMLIRTRQDLAFERLMSMSFRAANCRIRTPWRLKSDHLKLIIECSHLYYGREPGTGPDPFGISDSFAVAALEYQRNKGVTLPWDGEKELLKLILR
ncbi:hypothetical protein N7478_011021 [Penicillium angulare]|uniref:uncharacterized protein n=1 Tax=Penicillium angulare TaxID=116970 RepID=UPI0025401323|nr:uncharacterized protein N7478_011021 [Penicillium angulare]KAJ5263416.1 hypothetical protein N7478_011021 [Penicillium angulare]